jgi:hypothetical protein
MIRCTPRSDMKGNKIARVNKVEYSNAVRFSPCQSLLLAIRIGMQIGDQSGREKAILPKPQACAVSWSVSRL